MVADVTVVGYGIMALVSSLELADRGMRVRLVGTRHAGEASSAAAGLLAPSLDPPPRTPVQGAAHRFSLAARDLYPGYVAALAERTGMAIPVNGLGILQLAMTEDDAAALLATLPDGSSWLDRGALAREEPELAHAAGAAWHPNDGGVEPLALLDALRAAVARHDGVSVAREDAVAVHATELGCNVLTNQENRFASDRVVLAAGAWTPLVEGAGAAAAAIEPVRGVMVAYRATPVRHVIYGPGGYVVPKRDGHTVAGSTADRAGFDATPTSEAIAAVRGTAGRICPSLAALEPDAAWGGLRPMTPDLLPILGVDPERPRVIHASGHSRNGILLAPITGQVVADLATDATVRHDLTPFLPGRFSR
jgi:glycine oxidase